MKKTLLSLLMLCAAGFASAEEYCGETITSTNGNHNATITCKSLGNNEYEFTFVSEDEFTGYNAAGSNFYANVNGVGGYHVSEHLVQNGKELSVTFESSAVPNFYAAALFVNYNDGEAQFNIPTDADFSATCSNYTEYDHAAPTLLNDNGTCNPLFTWETNDAGNVVITISAGEGTDGETKFRGTGMNGTFMLDGSADDFTTYFEKGKTDDYTYTLTLTDPANKESLMGKKISFSGQIECRSDIHTNDWSNYAFAGYTYGKKCEEKQADTEAPTGLTATVKESKGTKVIVTLYADDNQSNRIYYTVTDGVNTWNGAGNNGRNYDMTIDGLTASTTYNFTVVAKDADDNATSPVAFSATTAEAAPVTHFHGTISGTKENVPVGGEPSDVDYTINYIITRNADHTLSTTMAIMGDFNNADGLGNGSIGYQEAADWADFVNNGDGTRTRSTSKYEYEDKDGQTIHCFFHIAFAGGLLQPFFDYTVGSEGGTYTRETTSGNYGTLCLPFDCSSYTGGTVYEIAGVEKTAGAITGVVLNSVNTLAAGKAYLFEATGEEFTATYAGTTIATAPVASTGLVGNLNPTAVAVEDGNYIVVGNELCKVNGATVTCGQNRAYINLEGVAEYQGPAAAKVIHFDAETTGINNVNSNVNDNRAFNLAGQRVNANVKGIVIVNGKKFVNK